MSNKLTLNITPAVISRILEDCPEVVADLRDKAAKQVANAIMLPSVNSAIKLQIDSMIKQYFTIPYSGGKLDSEVVKSLNHAVSLAIKEQLNNEVLRVIIKEAGDKIYQEAQKRGITELVRQIVREEIRERFR